MATDSIERLRVTTTAGPSDQAMLALEKRWGDRRTEERCAAGEIGAQEDPQTETPRYLRRLAIGAMLLFLLCFRICCGLSLGLASEDSRQIYLIGLKSLLTRSWPYFGPDVTAHVQIPGALQGLMVSVPLLLLPLPEAPFLLLNLLSFSSLCVLAWYCARRLPQVPAWLIWTWVLTVPWSLDLSTQVYNPSYVLPGGIAFFVGFFEACPGLRRGLLRPQSASFLMGLGLFWVMQFHMSYVLLLPYAAASFLLDWHEGRRPPVRPVLAFAAGAAVSGGFLLPTFVRYGWSHGSGRTLSLIAPNPRNLPIHWRHAFDILARFLSFASLEIPRFIGGNLAARIAFVRHFWWLSPLVLILVAVGILQPLSMIGIALFAKKPQTPDWPAVRLLCLLSVGLLYVGFAFSRKPPHAHTFYVTFPIAILFSLYCWNEYLQRRAWQVTAAVLVAAELLLHSSLAIYEQSRHPWTSERRVIERALENGDYRELGDRRPGSAY